MTRRNDVSGDQRRLQTAAPTVLDWLQASDTLRASEPPGCGERRTARMRASGGGVAMTEPGAPSGRPSPLLVLATLAGYAAVVVWLTWPLAASLGSGLPH